MGGTPHEGWVLQINFRSTTETQRHPQKTKQKTNKADIPRENGVRNGVGDGGRSALVGRLGARRRVPLRSGSGTHWLPKTRAQRGHGFQRPQSSSTVDSVGSPGSCRWSRPPPSGGNLQSIGIGSSRTVGSPGNVQQTGSGGKPNRIYRRCVWRRSPQGRCLN